MTEQDRVERVPNAAEEEHKRQAQESQGKTNQQAAQEARERRAQGQPNQQGQFPGDRGQEPQS